MFIGSIGKSTPKITYNAIEPEVLILSAFACSFKPLCTLINAIIDANGIKQESTYHNHFLLVEVISFIELNKNNGQMKPKIKPDKMVKPI